MQKKIVEQCQMKGCNPVDTPMEQCVKAMIARPGTKKDVTRYRSIIGSLRYHVNTRPDIAYVVELPARFMEAPDKEHWAMVKRIVRYRYIASWVEIQKREKFRTILVGLH
jgi:hypothetical protein